MASVFNNMTEVTSDLGISPEAVLRRMRPAKLNTPGETNSRTPPYDR